MQAEEVQVLLQVLQGLVQGLEILSLASLLFFSFLSLTLKTGLAGRTDLTGPQLSLIWPLSCSVTHLPELSGHSMLAQHVRDISSYLLNFPMLGQQAW